jgi:hypothetical protein
MVVAPQPAQGWWLCGSGTMCNFAHPGMHPRHPSSPVYKRIGIVGNLAMLRREAAAYAAAAEGHGPGEPG